MVAIGIGGGLFFSLGGGSSSGSSQITCQVRNVLESLEVATAPGKAIAIQLLLKHGEDGLHPTKGGAQLEYSTHLHPPTTPILNGDGFPQVFWQLSLCPLQPAL